MAAGLLLIDTDVLIDYSRGIEKTKGILKNLEPDHIFAISVVTQLELMVAVKTRPISNPFKNSCPILRLFN